MATRSLPIFTSSLGVYIGLTNVVHTHGVRMRGWDMRHLESKLARDADSRYDAFGFALVIAAVICAITTALYGLAISFQGGFPSIP